MSSEAFRRDLLASGLLIDGGVTGLYHRSFTFEAIVRGLTSYVSAAGRDKKRRQLAFSPVIARTTLEGSGYLSSFPDLIGTISSFSGNDADLRVLQQRAETGSEWSDLMTPTNMSLCSAACHSVYPLVVGTPIPTEGLLYEVQSYCFRHEPSDDPARMQSFRMHEFVYLGTENGASEHRDEWLKRGRQLLTDLGLNLEVEVANDPFFGRVGKLLAAGQREKALKFEILAPISSDVPGAISSANYHEDHFGVSYGLNVVDGSVAHTACFGFGLERITLALLFRHGLDVALWPIDVREKLYLGDDDLSAAPA